MARVVTLREAVNEWVIWSKARGLAPSTVRDRLCGMGQLAKCVGWNTPVMRIGPMDIAKLFAQVQWAQTTRNNRVAQYRSFFYWCRACGLLPRNADPMVGWRMVKPPAKERLRIPESDWGTLLAACKTPKEHVVLATGLYLFLRGSEQQAIQVQHVHLADGEIDIYRRKTKEWDTMPIPTELEPYLRQQLEWLSAQVALRPDHYLIPGSTLPKKREPGTGRLIPGTCDVIPTKPFQSPHRIVQRVLKRCGYEVAGEGEHTLRRSGARAYFDHLVGNGYDGALRRVQSMLGHKDSAMTEVYLGLSLDRHARNLALAGKPMFPKAPLANVVPIRKGDHGNH